MTKLFITFFFFLSFLGQAQFDNSQLHKIDILKMTKMTQFQDLLKFFLKEKCLREN